MTSRLWEPITGSVVRIVDPYTIIIDIGYKDGVKEGMKFVIYAEGEEIRTPSGKALGRIEYPKAEVVASHVQEKLTLAKSSSFEDDEASARIAKALTTMAYTGRRRKELPIDAKNVKELESVDLKVRVGDKVRQTIPA